MLPRNLIVVPLHNYRFVGHFKMFPCKFNRVTRRASFLSSLTISLPSNFLSSLRLFQDNTFFRFQTITRTSCLPLRLLRLLFHRLIRVTRSSVPISNILRFIRVGFKRHLIALSKRRPFIVPIRALFQKFGNVFPRSNRAFLLMYTMFLIVIGPKLRILLLPFLINNVRFLHVLLMNSGALLQNIIFRNLPFLKHKPRAPFLFNLIRFLRNIALLLISLHRQLIGLLPYGNLTFPCAFPRSQCTYHLGFLLYPSANINGLILVVPNQFTHVLNFPTIVFLCTYQFGPLLPFLYPHGRRIRVKFNHVLHYLLFLFRNKSVVFSRLFNHKDIHLSNVDD